MSSHCSHQHSTRLHQLLPDCRSFVSCIAIRFYAFYILLSFKSMQLQWIRFFFLFSLVLAPAYSDGGGGAVSAVAKWHVEICPFCESISETILRECTSLLLILCRCLSSALCVCVCRAECLSGGIRAFTGDESESNGTFASKLFRCLATDRGGTEARGIWFRSGECVHFVEI